MQRKHTRYTVSAIVLLLTSNSVVVDVFDFSELGYNISCFGNINNCEQLGQVVQNTGA